MAADKIVREKFTRVFFGYLDSLPPMPSKIVRVFTSSTFTDTVVERNALMEQVYPKLKQFCREAHGLDFQVVDMRWGVRDEATDDHMTAQLCLTEIANCQRLSLGPNFVVFLGQKYGYRPLPTTVVSSEMHLLLDSLRDAADDTGLLDAWYREDTNAVPPVFVLQPISSILVNFNNKRLPKLQEQDAAAWWEAMTRMQRLLRRAARRRRELGDFTADQTHNYVMSVTEREVISGVLNAANTNEHCLFYVRHINGININNAKVAGRYVDLSQGQVDVEAAKLLSNLRDDRLPMALDAANVARFAVDWAGREGVDPYSHADYLHQLCDHFFERVSALVVRAIRKQQRFLADPVYTEILRHLHNCNTVCSVFRGRDDELNMMREYLLSRADRPMVIHGDHGCGKTSLLAKAAASARHWLGDAAKTVVVVRFLGTSPDSSSIVPLITSLCEQLAVTYERERGAAPTELSKLFLHFRQLSKAATAERPLVILLDSLELLSRADGAHELLWLPATLPAHVKLVASTTPGASGVFERLRRLVPDERQFVAVQALGASLAADVVAALLEAAARSLTERQWELVRRALQRSTLPVFVKLVAATVVRWKSYARPQDTLLAPSINESISALFDRIETQHGKLLVSHALSYITAARSGLSDSELEDLISLDDVVLNDVYQYHLPPTRRIPPLLWSRIRSDLPGYLSERAADGVIVLSWYHRQFREAAEERYFKNRDHLLNTHSALADYFLGVWASKAKSFNYTEIQRHRFGLIEREGYADRKVPLQPNVFVSEGRRDERFNLRKLNELPFQLLQAERTDDLLRLCLFNYDFLLSKVGGMPLQSLLADLDEASARLDGGERRQLQLVADALRLSAGVLTREPGALAFELVGRLLPLAADHGRVRALLLDCDVHAPARNCVLPAHHCFHSPGGPLQYSFDEHPFAVFGMQLTSDAKLLVSVSQQFIVWDFASADIARVVEPHVDGVFFALALSPDDSLAAAFTNNNQIVLASIVTGDFSSIWPAGLTEQMSLEGLRLSTDTLVAWSSDEVFFFSLGGQLQRRLHVQQYDGAAFCRIEHFSQHCHFLLVSANANTRQLSVFATVAGQTAKPISLSDAVAIDSETSFFGLCDGAIFKFEFANDDWRKSDWSLLLDDPTWQVFDLCVVGSENPHLVAVLLRGFQLWQLKTQEHIAVLKLPDGVRNVLLKPMRTITSVVVLPKEQLFVAALRRYLYFWNTADGSLLQTLDAHFGRILNLTSVSIDSQTTLISSSIDHCIKMWNIGNMFEKSFFVDAMDQPIEEMRVASQQPALAAVRTRKYVAVWNIRTHRVLGTLAASLHGAVVTHCLISSDALRVVSAESDLLLVWHLRTLAVAARVRCARVVQLLFLAAESRVAAVTAVSDDAAVADTPRVARLLVYKIADLSVCYSYEWPARVIGPATPLTGQVLLALVGHQRGRDVLHVLHADTGTFLYQLRPRRKGRQAGGELIESVVAMPHNPNQVAVVGSDHRADVWDVKNRKHLRSVTCFTGGVTTDGRYGLHAPSRGGLEVVDMRSGVVVHALIPRAALGITDAMARFTPTDRHVLYYDGAGTRLRVFRLTDGKQVGTLRPHAQLTCFAVTPCGRQLLLGGEDGSVLVAALVDPCDADAMTQLARLPQREALAAHLGVERVSEDYPAPSLSNLLSVARAVTRFKGLLKQQRSVACSIQ